MILLDSNVVSALMELELHPEVRAWLRGQKRHNLGLPAPSLFEVRFGIDSRPLGRRRKALQAALDEVLALVDGRVLPLDARGALLAAEVRARQRKRGITAEVPDTLIAGVALSFDAEIATRNVSDFKETGVTLINPWEGV